MNNVVTLKRFLEIVGYDDTIMTYLCHVYVEKDDKGFYLVKFNGSDVIQEMSNLEPYYGYEIITFDQDYLYGELDSQSIWLRKVEHK